MMLAAISLLIGVALGQRFKVMSLLPAFVLVAVASGVLRFDSIASILLFTAVAAASLQIGYLGGVIIRSPGTRILRKREIFHQSLE